MRPGVDNYPLVYVFVQWLSDSGQTRCCDKYSKQNSRTEYVVVSLVNNNTNK